MERGIRELEKGVFRVRVWTSDVPLTGNPIQRERIVRGGIRRARDIRVELESELRESRIGGADMTVGALLDAWLRAVGNEWASPAAPGLNRALMTAMSSKRAHSQGDAPGFDPPLPAQDSWPGRTDLPRP